MDRKRTNLCVSVDVTEADEVLEIVRMVGGSVCMVKVGLLINNPKRKKEKKKRKQVGLTLETRRTVTLLKTLHLNSRPNLSSFQSNSIL